MSQLITPDLEVKSVFPIGDTWTLEEMYHLLDCTNVVMVPALDGREIWIDGEALLKNPRPKVNLLTTALFGQEMLLGNALITKPGEVE